MKTARLLLLVAVSVAPAVGQPAKEPSFYGGTAQDLMEMCRKVKVIDADPSKAGQYVTELVQCGQYALGIADGFNLSRVRHPEDRYFCFPGTVSQEELTRVLVKFADDHPEKLHYQAAVFVLGALVEAYPCKAP